MTPTAGPKEKLPPLGAPLTDIQIKIVAGYARGRDNIRIGEDLAMSKRTVQSHARCIAAAFGCGTRPAIVDHAYREGYLHGLTPELRGTIRVTKEEWQVMRHLGSDLTFAQIAETEEDNGVTPEAVKSRTKTLYRRLRVSDRAHAVAIGWQRGYFTTKTEGK